MNSKAALLNLSGARGSLSDSFIILQIAFAQVPLISVIAEQQGVPYDLRFTLHR